MRARYRTLTSNKQGGAKVMSEPNISSDARTNGGTLPMQMLGKE
jgi:hypothetical protein